MKKFMMRFQLAAKNILFSILMMMSVVGFSQNRRFKHLTSKDGISQSEIYSFLEDSKGFMWFGTVDGLNKYNGYDIETFYTKKNDSHALSNNTVRCLAEDQYGRIWIGTDDGLNFYNPRTELLYQVIVNNESKFSVWSLLIKDDHLLVGTNGGLWRTTIQSMNIEDIESGFQKITHFSNNPTIDNSLIRAIIKSKSGGIWVLTSDNLSRIFFQQNSNKPIVIEDLSFSDFSHQETLVEDSSNNLWIASSENGLLRYNLKTKKTTYFNEFGRYYGPSSKKCSSLSLDKKGNLWIGTLDKGLDLIKTDELNKKEIHFEKIENEPYNFSSLNSNLIYSLYVSSENDLWVGTIGAGVNIYNPEQKKFDLYRFHDLNSTSSNSNFIRSVYADNNNRIWTGTHNNGLFLLDRKEKKFQKLGFGTLPVFYIANYKNNKNLICSGHGVYLVELVDNNLKILSQSSIGNNSATFNIIKSKQGVYWYGTVDGLARADIHNDKINIDKIYTKNTMPGISTNNCRVLFYNNNYNELLIGTEGGGLNIFSLDKNHYPEKVKVYRKNKDSNSLSNNYIRTIIKDKNQNIWIGTYEGLNKLIRDSITGEISFKTYTKEDGLPNNMIQLIVEDDDGYLWIGTNGGLSQFFPDEERFINYTVNDGLQSNEFSEHTVFKKSDGEIIMGGINGINAFYPEQIKLSSVKPKPTVTDFYLFNKRVNALEKVGKNVPLVKNIIFTDTILLLPKQKNIGFDFSAMILSNASKIKYAYKLEGFQNSWHFTDASHRNANYTNLKHGEYVFKVKATNNDGIWEDTTREIYIKIKTPFFLSIYAFVLYILFVVFVFVYFSHYTIIRYTTKKRLLLEKEHDQKLHELDELRTIFFINISHDLRTPLALISGPLESILHNENLNKEVKEKLYLIKRNVKRLHYLVDQLLDIRKAESGKLSAKLKTEDMVTFTDNEVAHFTFAISKKGLELEVASQSEKMMACFDPGMISKVYFNLISNAIKYTDEGKIRINIERVDKKNFEILNDASFNSFIMVEIQDSGRGMSKEQELYVFDRFYQDERYPGAGYGIGLSHTKQLIDAHNGFIELFSKENVGTTIRFFLPDIEVDVKSPVSNIASNIASNEDIYASENSIETVEDVTEKKSAKCILVVEDNVDMRSFIKAELNNEYNVIEASDGTEGLKKAETKIPDLIVSDVMMPRMDGIEFCNRIKSNINTSHIPVILLTAKVDSDTKYEGIENGADDYIPKPFEIEYLILRIRNLLHSREQLRNKFQNKPALEPSAVTVTSVDEKFLSSLMKVIEAGIPDPDFSVSSLESEMGMSHANFYRKIKSLTGQSGQELLLSMRMKRAHQILLQEKGLRVSEVAFMVGFTNPKYFSKCFKEMFGVAPSELMN